MKKSVFALLAMALVSASFASKASAHEAAAPDLRGSAWEGTYTVARVANPIRVAFLNELTAKGEVPYFHKIITAGVTSELLGTVDQACDFTPRAVVLKPGQPVTGTISVFSCVPSLEEEMKLEANVDRRAQASVPISSAELSADGATLRIRASILGVPVAYELQRQALSPETAASRETMRAWLDK